MGWMDPPFATDAPIQPAYVRGCTHCCRKATGAPTLSISLSRVHPHLTWVHPDLSFPNGGCTHALTMSLWMHPHSNNSSEITNQWPEVCMSPWFYMTFICLIDFDLNSLRYVQYFPLLRFDWLIMTSSLHPLRLDEFVLTGDLQQVWRIRCILPVSQFQLEYVGKEFSEVV